MRETRAELAAHVGGKPSAVQAAMIERACQLTLRIVAMDRKFAETGAQTDHDSRTYLAWSNSLSGHVFLPCAHALLLDIRDRQPNACCNSNGIASSPRALLLPFPSVARRGLGGAARSGRESRLADRTGKQDL
jgi:hypothetical protein